MSLLGSKLQATEDSGLECIITPSEMVLLGWQLFRKVHKGNLYTVQHQYNAFQNICCPAVSYSRFACNSNISAIMPGPIGQYKFKYNIKDTQKDDVAPYTHVAEATHRALNAA